jgi:hypothetical protein
LIPDADKSAITVTKTDRGVALNIDGMGHWLVNNDRVYVLPFQTTADDRPLFACVQVKIG